MSKKPISSSTKEIHASAKIEASGRNYLGIPIIQGSTILFDTYQGFINSAIDRKSSQINDITKKLPDYGRSGNETSLAVEKIIAEFENADYCKLFPTGIAAIRISIMAFTYSGCHILISEGIYLPVKVMIEEFLTKFGVEFTYFDPITNEEELMKLTKKNTALVYTELPCSNFFEVANIDAIINVSKRINAISICDNSYFTWLNFKPLDAGFDVSVTSLTKYAAGHSDILAGSVCVKEKHFNNILAANIYMGDHFSANCASSLLRGIRTMSLRMECCTKNVIKFIEYLKNNKFVTKIYHPSIKDSIGYEYFIKHIKNAPSLLSVALDKKYSHKQMAEVFESMTLFGLGYSYGGSESLAIPLAKTIRHFNSNYISDNSCMRIYVGLENIDDLIEDFDNALHRLSN